MEINKSSQATTVTLHESSAVKAPKDEQVPANQAVVQQDTVEISKEAYVAAAKDQEAADAKDITKMSEEQRAELVEKLKAKLEEDQAKLFDFVRKTLAGQANALAAADDVWKFIASGNYEVDEATKTEAQEAISEDGFYGVKQTSERIYEFALAMSGGDKAKMKELEAAFEEGFKEATKSWGKDLPDISQQTYDAVKDKFKAFYDEAA